MSGTDFDVVVVGGGIVGIATARELSRQFPGLSVCILEKEGELATHQTGRNSGVIHAGVYYTPGTMKARFCREGSAATKQFCREHGIPFEECGKLIVATSEEERPRFAALHARAVENGLEVELLDGAELSRREPHIRGVGAILVPTSGIVSYGEVARAMAGEVRAAGGTILTGHEVRDVREEPDAVTVATDKRTLRARHLVACAGLWADRLAQMCGVEREFRVVPFRGEYYRLAPRHDAIVRHLIYPVPDPALPFLGVHLTRMIGGYVTVGPNAVLAFAREGYTRGTVDLREMAGMFAYGGFRKLVRANIRSGLDEMHNSLSKQRYLELCRRYCPELELDDLLPYRSGVRAQVVLPDGTLLHDFLVEDTARTVHVCNAPSPAATSSIPIARHVVAHAAERWGLKAGRALQAEAAGL